MWWRRCPALQLEAPFLSGASLRPGPSTASRGVWTFGSSAGRISSERTCTCTHVFKAWLAAPCNRRPDQIFAPKRLRGKARRPSFGCALISRQGRGAARRAHGCRQAMLSARFTSDGPEHSLGLLMYSNDWHAA
ncbi:uncharacterized protein B0H64DRAFT_67030, partial [Chaetomium fimeti]